jgi:hypothetical protein
MVALDVEPLSLEANSLLQGLAIRRAMGTELRGRLLSSPGARLIPMSQMCHKRNLGAGLQEVGSIALNGHSCSRAPAFRGTGGRLCREQTSRRRHSTSPALQKASVGVWATLAPASEYRSPVISQVVGPARSRTAEDLSGG